MFRFLSFIQNLFSNPSKVNETTKTWWTSASSDDGYFMLFGYLSYLKLNPRDGGSRSILFDCPEINDEEILEEWENQHLPWMMERGFLNKGTFITLDRCTELIVSNNL